jgi:diketogulonate reductase-like aldo/keto reductase
MGTYYDPLWITTSFLGWRRGAASKVKAVQAGLDAGITLVDTAEIYGSESLVAEAIRQGKREDIFLATKVWSNHLHRDALLRSFEKSLRRLGTTYIDLYQVHWPNPRVPIGETMAAMDELVSAGKLMHVGVSNFNLSQLEEANSALPKSQLRAVQLNYSLVHRSVETDILPYCDREGIALLAYYPLGHGKLVSSSGIDGVAARYQKSRAQVALRWLARRQNVFPIPRASSVGHVAEDARASGWDITDQDAADLEARFQ